MSDQSLLCEEYREDEVNALLTSIKNAKSADAKGDLFEDFITYFFDKIPGVELAEENRYDKFGTNEIDRVFNNYKLGIMSIFPFLLFIECKWGEAVGSRDLILFEYKLRQRGLKFGILISAEGITGNSQNLTYAHQVIANALLDERSIIILTKRDLLSTTNSLELVRLLIRKYTLLKTKRTSITD